MRNAARPAPIERLGLGRQPTHHPSSRRLGHMSNLRFQTQPRRARRRTRHLGPPRHPQLTAALECENDAGGRFTLSPSGNAHPPSCLYCRTATSCGPAARLPGGTRAARAVAGATRLAEGSVRARGEVEIHTTPPALLGSLPHQQSLAGRPRQAPLRGAGPHARRPHRWRHGGRPRPGSTRRTTLPVQHGRAVRSLPHYVGPDASVSHPSRCRSPTGRFILNRGIRARDEKAVAAGSGAQVEARASKTAERFSRPPGPA